MKMTFPALALGILISQGALAAGDGTAALGGGVGGVLGNVVGQQLGGSTGAAIGAGVGGRRRECGGGAKGQQDRSGDWRRFGLGRRFADWQSPGRHHRLDHRRRRGGRSRWRAG